MCFMSHWTTIKWKVVIIITNFAPVMTYRVYIVYSPLSQNSEVSTFTDSSLCSFWCTVTTCFDWKKEASLGRKPLTLCLSSSSRTFHPQLRITSLSSHNRSLYTEIHCCQRLEFSFNVYNEHVMFSCLQTGFAVKTQQSFGETRQQEQTVRCLTVWKTWTSKECFIIYKKYWLLDSNKPTFNVSCVTCACCNQL